MDKTPGSQVHFKLWMIWMEGSSAQMEKKKIPFISSRFPWKLFPIDTIHLFPMRRYIPSFPLGSPHITPEPQVLKKGQLSTDTGPFTAENSSREESEYSKKGYARIDVLCSMLVPIQEFKSMQIRGRMGPFVPNFPNTWNRVRPRWFFSLPLDFDSFDPTDSAHTIYRACLTPESINN